MVSICLGLNVLTTYHVYTIIRGRGMHTRAYRSTGGHKIVDD